MTQLTIGELYRRILTALAPTLGDSEARSASKIILEDVRGVTPTDLVVNSHRTVEPETETKINTIVNKIIAGEPVQYAVGTARFYGFDFKVTPDVLIPRPETESLIDLIIDDFRDKKDLKILDCGTGSGCIAISLARSLPFSEVTAIDVSQPALKIAIENSHRLDAKVNFRLVDILRLNSHIDNVYDIIVSNPPYISPDESAEMDSRVLDYEPRSALFVPADDPLIFYRAIAEFGLSKLKNNGKLYFEINPRYSIELKELLTKIGYTGVDIIRDYIGHNRFAIASKL